MKIIDRKHLCTFITLQHRFPTFFEAGTPFINIKLHSLPFLEKQRNHGNSAILQYLHFLNYYL